MKNVVLFDIDGCCLEPSEARIKAYVEGDYDLYHKLAPTDTPIEAGILVYKSLMANPALRCVFLTDRSELNREYTQQHLNGLGLGGVPLLMRNKDWPREGKTENGMPGHESKPRTLLDAGYTFDEILLVIEDRRSIVDMWRAKGILCYETKDDNYRAYGWDVESKYATHVV
jgi:hypothetical protein